MAGHVQLKFVMTECSKTQIRLRRHKICKRAMSKVIIDYICVDPCICEERKDFASSLHIFTFQINEIKFQIISYICDRLDAGNSVPKILYMYICVDPCVFEDRKDFASSLHIFNFSNQ